MLLVVDNYDSFTWNLVAAFRQLGAQVEVVRNDACSVHNLLKSSWQGVVLSPGPGSPDQSGICSELLRQLPQTTPVLGICLGHQLMAWLDGALVEEAMRPMHGHVSHMWHTESGIFAGIPSPAPVMRYHSLVVREATLRPSWQVTARSDAGEVMALQHSLRPWTGLQFHPESILTPDGPQMLQTWLSSCACT